MAFHPLSGTMLNSSLQIISKDFYRRGDAQICPRRTPGLKMGNEMILRHLVDACASNRPKTEGVCCLFVHSGGEMSVNVRPLETSYAYDEHTRESLLMRAERR